MKHHLPADYSEVDSKPIRKQMILVAGIFLGTFLIGAFSMLFWPKTYTAKATIMVEPFESSHLTLSDLRFNSRNFLNTQRAVIKSKGLLMKLASEKNLSKRWGLTHRRTAARLQNATSVKRHLRDNVIDIRYSSPNPDEAIEVANAIGAAYIDHWRDLHNDRYDEMISLMEADHEQFKSAVAIKLAAFELLNTDDNSSADINRAKQDLEKMQEKNKTFESRLEKINLERVMVNSAARFSEPATMNTLYHGVKVGPGFFFIFLVSVFVTSISAGLIFHRVERKSTVVELAKVMSPSNLTLIPQPISSLTHHSEPVQQVGRRILDQFPNPEGVAISAIPCLIDEDASPLACELAKTLGEAGFPTLLIDGNLAEPIIHAQFNASHQPGLAEFLSGEMELQQTVVKTRFDNLWVMPGGEAGPDSTKQLGSQRMDFMIEDAKSRFDFVIFNGAPILSSVDSLVLIGESDLTFLCTEADRASSDVLNRTRYAIDEAGGKLGGFVFTSVREQDVKATEELSAAEPRLTV